MLSDARIIIDARLAELRSVDGDTLTRPFEVAVWENAQVLALTSPEA